jgi:hypothetical protein
MTQKLAGGRDRKQNLVKRGSFYEKLKNLFIVTDVNLLSVCNSDKTF